MDISSDNDQNDIFNQIDKSHDITSSEENKKKTDSESILNTKGRLVIF